MYKANLSFTQLNEYLYFLLKLELISLTIDEGREVYKITENGIDFLQRHSELSRLMKVLLK
jgi:predicted transcriptional regulator